MRRLLRFLWRHPLVWLVPVLTYGVLLVYLLTKLASAPQDAFMYRI